MKAEKWCKATLKDFLDQSNKIRGVGRTTVLAEVFIELAKENRNIPIEIYDHFPGKGAIENLLRIIEDKLYYLNEAELENGYRTRYILLKNNKLVYTDDNRNKW